MKLNQIGDQLVCLWQSKSQFDNGQLVFSVSAQYRKYGVQIWSVFIY